MNKIVQRTVFLEKLASKSPEGLEICKLALNKLHGLHDKSAR